MIKSIKNFFASCKNKFNDWRQKRKIKKKLKEIQDRDPFIYD